MRREVFQSPEGPALSYIEWNREGAGPPIVCVHGLTRNALDFERLGEALAGSGRHVVSLDVVGRGESGRLEDPSAYGYPQYLSDSLALARHLDAESLDWVGTSMGGLIGMMLAAQQPDLIRRMVVNDVGAFIPKAALERIAEYLSYDWRFESLAHADAHLQKVYLPFGITDADHWRRFLEISVVPDGDGGYLPNYDPAIAAPFKDAHLEDVALWEVWDAVSAEVLLLRGAQSDLLLPETADEMTRRGPGCQVQEFQGVGHAPPLMEEAQIAPVRRFLNEA